MNPKPNPDVTRGLPPIQAEYRVTVSLNDLTNLANQARICHAALTEIYNLCDPCHVFAGPEVLREVALRALAKAKEPNPYMHV